MTGVSYQPAGETEFPIQKMPTIAVFCDGCSVGHFFAKEPHEGDDSHRRNGAAFLASRCRVIRALRAQTTPEVWRMMLPEALQ